MRPWYNKSMNSKKWVWVLLIIVVILVATAGGVIYWSFNKAKKVADSALHSVQNNQPTPSFPPSPSASSLQSSQPRLSMPASDVAGEDLADAPRFSESIRTSYEKESTDVINLEYMVKASQDQILKFYKDQLPTTGWLLRAEDPTSLNFSKDNVDLSIEIVLQDKNSQITQYQIHYISTPNTE